MNVTTLIYMYRMIADGDSSVYLKQGPTKI